MSEWVSPAKLDQVVAGFYNARYGRCPGCKRPFAAGQLVTHQRGRRDKWHLGCSDAGVDLDVEDLRTEAADDWRAAVRDLLDGD